VNLPTNDGWGDFQFYPLTDRVEQIEIDTRNKNHKDISIDTILKMLNNYETKTRALIFETKVGKGNLFVANCRFDMENPSCVTLNEGNWRQGKKVTAGREGVNKVYVKENKSVQLIVTRQQFSLQVKC
jgi:hypothetical protein